MDWDNLDDYVVGAVAYDQWVSNCGGSRTAPLRLLFFYFVPGLSHAMRIEWRDRPFSRTSIATCYLRVTSFRARPHNTRAPRLRLQVFEKPQAVGLTPYYAPPSPYYAP